jgi:hypothetical protein
MESSPKKSTTHFNVLYVWRASWPKIIKIKDVKLKHTTPPPKIIAHACLKGFI